MSCLLALLPVAQQSYVRHEGTIGDLDRQSMTLGLAHSRKVVVAGRGQHELGGRGDLDLELRARLTTLAR